MNRTAPSPTLPQAPTPAFGQALRWWFELGCIGFGGPAGQISLMHDELVVRRRWLSEARFSHALGFCMLLPGPEAQQLATYAGWLLHGTRGGIAAGLLFVLPSLLLMMALAATYLLYGQLGWVAGLFAGIKPAVVALVVAAAWRLGRRSLDAGWKRAVAALAFAGLLVGLPFPVLLAGAAATGWWLRARTAPDAPSDAPLPSGAAAPRATLRLVAVFVAVWALALGGLVATGGLQGLYPALAWFHTKAALLTFGGAYAVLPYVFDAAVQQHAWLSAGQMLDGLALGESTPGPLIMIVAWVGFLAGWQQPGVLPPGAAGMAGALVATFFTFLPSFLFVLAGAPFVERTRGLPAFQAPLAGITAAVVGVIAQLGVWLGAEVLFAGQRPQALAIAIFAASLLALLRYGRTPMQVLPAAAAVGLASALIS